MSLALAIVGMHRSGTSVTANWLADCGLYIGERLIGVKPSNIKGHFEDLDFVEFHDDILTASNINYLVQPGHRLCMPADAQTKAHRLVDQRANQQQWGWKDPRTSLFLDFWKKIIPDLKVLVVYRHYSEVVDSLLRREKYSPRNRKDFFRAVRYSFFNRQLCQRYIRSWYRHNNDILEFYQRCPQDCLVIPTSKLSDVSDRVVEHLNKRWEFQLTQIDMGKVFDSELMHSSDTPKQTTMLQKLEPKAETMLQELSAVSMLSQ